MDKSSPRALNVYVWMFIRVFCRGRSASEENRHHVSYEVNSGMAHQRAIIWSNQYQPVGRDESLMAQNKVVGADATLLR